MLAKKLDLKSVNENHSTTYSDRYFTKDIPKFEIPEEGMPSDAAYRLIKDELNLDGNPALNLATFVTTWMEPEADKLISENLNKNFIDHDEYPQTDLIHTRCVNMLARLFNSPDECKSVGTSTIGSSEAIMLALLAHKWKWREKRRSEGKDFSSPNIVMGTDVHTVWDKFAKYFDVTPKLIPMKKNKYTITPNEVRELIDENTICVGAIMGTTYTGQADPVIEINDILIQYNKETGIEIPIHVDGASGGFVTPFIFPGLEWDFRLEQVKSINVSGHKYGLVYPGIGWVIFRDESDMPEELIFRVNYLGDEMPTYTLNFSKGSSMLLAQYYNFLRLGKSGYKRIMSNVMDNASYLESGLEKLNIFDIINPNRVLPVMTLALIDNSKFTVFDLSGKLREKGWIVPAYTLPPDAEETEVLRIVLKENQSRDMMDILTADIKACFEELSSDPPSKKPSSLKNKGKKIID